MKYLFLHLLILSSCSFEQSNRIELKQTLNDSEKTFQKKKNSFGLTLFKNFDSLLVIMYNDSSANQEAYSTIRIINLNTQKLERHIRLKTYIGSSYSFCDLVLNNQGIWYLDSWTLLHIAFNGELNEIAKDIKFHRMHPLGDDQLLLFDLEPHHPFDATSNLRLRLYDCKTGQWQSLQEFENEGYSTGFMINEWLITLGKNIVTAEPFDFRIQFWDKNLAIYKVVDLNKHFHYSLNTSIIEKFDSEKRVVDSLLLDAGNNGKEQDYIDKLSSYYAKDRMQVISKTVRDSVNYIEKLMTYNDSVLVVTVHKAGYQMDYRDVHFYDFKNDVVINSIIKWKTSDKLEAGEKKQNAIIDVICSNLSSPFFYRDHVFAPRVWFGNYNSQSEDGLTDEERAKKFFEAKQKFGPTWALGKYSYQ